MKKGNRFKKVILLGIGCLFVFSGKVSNEATAARAMRLIVDGKDITSLSSPTIENDRTFVPISFISEELGAEVIWNNDDKTVRIEKGNKSILLRIGSHLIEYDNGNSYELSDVAPKIINGRTFVPIRLVSNAFDIGVNWDETNKSVYVDSSKTSDIAPLYDVKIISHKSGQTISGKTELQISSSETYLKDGNEIRFLLLDPNTAKGFVIARGEEPIDSYSWLPRLEDKGEKVLVGAIYDRNGKFIAGDAIPVNIDIVPEVNVAGLEDGQIIESSVSIGADVNFVSSYIKYEITNLDNGKTTITEEEDPQGTFKWNLEVKNGGNYSIKVIAYDKDSKPYPSKPINVQVAIIPKLSLVGVSTGVTINKSVSLAASRNFDVSETEYLIKDVSTGIVSTLAKLPYGEYKWFPGPEFSGAKELSVRVKDSRGKTIESNKVEVTVDGTPKLLLQGIGPKQVITEPTKVKVSSNVKLEDISYVLINKKSGNKRILASKMDPSVEYTYSPAEGDIGDVILQAEGIYQGEKVLSEEILFKVYFGDVFGPKPIIEKDKFLGLASELAKVSREKTGMSAALQTAQAILETGWGQSVPVDKYTGLLSNNLFGIKGQGSAGAVISNTWEVYNGTTYRVDAEFRAYDSVNMSWADHKEFLLTRERYAPFKLVMHESTQGAWALKSAGYATDPKYPIKLMEIINQYNLLELDKVGI